MRTAETAEPMKNREEKAGKAKLGGFRAAIDCGCALGRKWEYCKLWGVVVGSSREGLFARKSWWECE